MSVEGKLWGGRFSVPTHAAVEALNNSLPFDQRLWRQDIAGSIAHATMLGECGIVPPEDAEAIIAALQEIEQGLAAGEIVLDPKQEDIHSAIEALLREKIGPTAGKLHTARSRNDQVCTDLRLYLRDAVDTVLAEISELQNVLLAHAEMHLHTVLPGCTHLQHGQPVTLAHHLMAYWWMLDRDAERLSDARRRINRSPLGAGALAGTTFPISRERTAELLGFEQVLQNSMDAVADRDFAFEFLAAAAMLSIHLSRFAEELILWSAPEYSFVELDDSVTTGSSIMPQKKNPDVAELARAKPARLLGHLMALGTLQKGLPLTYNKDLQEDKEPVFDAVDTLMLTLPAFRRMVETAVWRTDRMLASTERDFSTATDIADHLVRHGLPFREAHEVVGRIVRDCIDRCIGLEDLQHQLAEYHPSLAAGSAPDISVLGSVNSRSARGGTSPEAVRRQIAEAKAGHR
jgi:argininosuccinate lyase